MILQFELLLTFIHQLVYIFKSIESNEMCYGTIEISKLFKTTYFKLFHKFFQNWLTHNKQTEENWKQFIFL